MECDKFHTTCCIRWQARPRSPYGAPLPRGSHLPRVPAACWVGPQTPLWYRGDNITMIPGQRLRERLFAACMTAFRPILGMP